MPIFDKFKLKKEGRSKSKNIEEATGTQKESLALNLSRSQGLIKQAWVSEKASRLAEDRKYVFIVSKKANKPEVKKAIQSMYGVLISGINIVEMKGKSKRLGRTLGRTSDFKKAIITLKEGHKIEI